jgi:hypothetical protein
MGAANVQAAIAATRTQQEAANASAAEAPYSNQADNTDAAAEPEPSDPVHGLGIAPSDNHAIVLTDRATQTQEVRAYWLAPREGDGSSGGGPPTRRQRLVHSNRPRLAPQVALLHPHIWHTATAAARNDLRDDGIGTPARRQRLVCSDPDSYGRVQDIFEPTVASTTLRTLLHPSFWPEIVVAAAHQRNLSTQVTDEHTAAGADPGDSDDEAEAPDIN